jgi:hypothetical protein
MDFVYALVPIAVSCVMPITIVGLIARVRIKNSEHKMNVMIKAIENGAEVDPSVLMAVKSKTKTTRTDLVGRLGAGVGLTLMGLFFIMASAFGLASFPEWGYYPGLPLLAAGIGFLVSFFFGIKFLKTQIEAEDNK